MNIKKSEIDEGPSSEIVKDADHSVDEVIEQYNLHQRYPNRLVLDLKLLEELKTQAGVWICEL